MKTILVPFDFSTTSHQALKAAFQIADQIKASLRIIHISSIDSKQIKEPFTPEAKQLVDELKYEQIMEGIIKRQFSLAFPKVEIEWNIINRSKKVSSHIADEATDCDLVVMGTNGANQMLSKVFGSTTTNVIDMVEKPVLTIPTDLVYDGILDQVLYVCDLDGFSIENTYKLNYLFQKAVTPKITCLDVNSGHNPHIDELAEKLAKEYNQLNFVVVEANDEIEAIKTYADNNKFDLIAITSKGRNWLQKLVERSYTENLLFSADLPILAL